MERGKSLFIFKVKGQISRSLGLYKELCNSDPYEKDTARNMQSLCSNLVCTLDGSERSQLNFKVKVTGSL